MVNKAKIKEVEDMAKDMDSCDVVALLNMHSLPSRQLQQIKKKLKDMVKIKMNKKTLILRAVEKTKNKKLLELAEKIKGEPALLFTNENPFKIYQYLKKNKSPISAKEGDIALDDITISKGPTGIAPGPAMSQLQKVGLKTTVEGGKIAIASDTTVLKKGEKVTADMAGVLNLLGLEPMEVGLNVVAACEVDTIYTDDILNIDTQEYINFIVKGVQEALNLSINTGFLTPETAAFAIQKAFIEAKQLAIEASILTPDAIGSILAKAVAEEKALENLI